MYREDFFYFRLLWSSIYLYTSTPIGIRCQFPTVCANNLTTRLPAICCPTPPNASLPCGGPGRGLCQDINAFPEDLDLIPLNGKFLLDDRLAWPTRFFEAACACQGNFQGYACHRCKDGWTGVSCRTRKSVRVRRNVLQMTLLEQRAFRDRIILAKRTPMTEWLVINISDSSNGDPVEQDNLQLIQAPSIYDYFVFIHLYASRSSLIVDDTNGPRCSPNEHILDFAHKGPAFITWHRAYLLLWESELARLGIAVGDSTVQRDGDDFTLPYWDWTSAEGCPICTNDLVGAPDLQSNTGGLDPTSVFSNWITYCPQRPGINDCHVCDPGVTWSSNPNHPMAGGPLWRIRSGTKYTSTFSRLPDQNDVLRTLETPDYDVWPYRITSGRRSFRDVLEGFTDPKIPFNATDPKDNQNVLSTVAVTTNWTNITFPSNRTSITDIPVYMHNLVHSYFNGSWFDVSTSPNDPLFILHHTFVDKLFELWFRKYRPSPSQYPRRGCPPGHSAYSPIVPLFPVIENIAYFVDSRSLGYDYDDYKAGSTIIVPAELATINLASVNDNSLIWDATVIGTAVLAVILFSTLILITVLGIAYFRTKRLYYSPVDNIEEPQISVANNWRRAPRYLIYNENYQQPPLYGQHEKTHLLDNIA
ncbi:unnamed protein product [Heterobilharzia americana]|nr:unnamed protein product [Heterobilharzia americana]CAH8537757.1 unnamed protein product [Heterobilharzia americana]